jgi:hypothetical protein
MANADLRFEDRLEGASNFSPWRERIALVLEEQGLWEFVEGSTMLPTYPAQQPAHLRKYVKARRIIIDGVKDHIIPHLSGKKTAKDMWEALPNCTNQITKAGRCCSKRNSGAQTWLGVIQLLSISPSSLRLEMRLLSFELLLGFFSIY